MSGAAPDRIRLSGVRGRGFHGVFEHERREGQEFVVDVELAVDLSAAGATDDLADTVDYGRIGAAALARIEGEPHDLIERLAELVALDALAHPAVDEVVVTVHKPQAPVGVPFGDVTVSVTRRRAPVPVVVAVGANLPRGSSSPDDTARAAIEALAGHPALTGTTASGLYDTDPVGGPEQPTYVNAVVTARTTSSPLIAAEGAARGGGRLRPPPGGAVGAAHARPRPRAVRRPVRGHRRHLRPAAPRAAPPPGPRAGVRARALARGRPRRDRCGTTKASSPWPTCSPRLDATGRSRRAPSDPTTSGGREN